MHFFGYMLMLMLLALIVRFVGWCLYVINWLSGDGNHLSLMDAVLIGLPQGWAIASPFVSIVGNIIGIIVAISAVLLLVPLLLARVTRKSDPTVFISYQNSKQIYAQRLSEVLGSNGFKVQFLPFERKAMHDPLLQRIDQAISAAQFVVCFPGKQPSFVEAEVLAAAMARKSIIFVIDYPGGRMPNTAAKTYPVLTTKGVVEADFLPLVELLGYLHGGWKATLNLYFLPNAPIKFLKWLNYVTSATALTFIMALFSILWIGGLIAFALEYFFPQSYKITILIVGFAGFFCLICLFFNIILLDLLTNAVSGIIRRQRAATAARHAIKLGICTPTILRSAFAPVSNGLYTSEVGFLAALWPDQPLAHHEKSPS